MTPRLEKAIFAAGCFWGVEAYFRRLKGVRATTVGYTGGTTEDPSYEEVCTGRTGHAESIEVEFDPTVITFERLVEHFWKVHDPTQRDRQGNDIGFQYRSAIFFLSPDQEKTARNAKDTMERSGLFRRHVVTEIVPAGRFYPAEDYHQDYLEKHPGGYCHVDLSSIEDG